jgi:arylsulfatase A-like enzyme
MFEISKIIFALLALTFAVSAKITAQENRQPNVVLIITDDQGYGDLGFTGNPHVKTPIIDNFARESIRFNQFYVSPVCAPTRASLMTGRFSLRTGVRDTYNGGAIMATEEVTIAEMLKQADYKTGIFGKWHLGDNYPSRPGDQGFDESLDTKGTMFLETNSLIFRQKNENTPTDIIEMKDMYFSDMECDLIPQYVAGGKSIFPLWVELEKIQ